jgi:2-amino-4-hydroxy-6-hydroxymethyldihydropteridine diphosphokinase
MATVYLGLGSNESPEKNLRLAVSELRSRYGELALSAVYKSAAVGFEGADFLNLVARLETEDLPLEICNEIERIHDLAGRVRSSSRWKSRPIDIDLLLYDDMIRDERPVHVPRDDILQYSFVLRPLAEIAPDQVHPVTAKTYSDHWQAFDADSHPLTKIDVSW